MIEIDNNTALTGFMAISSLYLKMTDNKDTLVDDEEIELFIGSIDQSNLVLLIGNDEPTENLTEKAA
ncbi:MAG: hypothetical protein GKR93_11010 [Gammaproteobacteria bacterium]|nr:hypothetical protein [Gammaproteobacteria bacterium]